MIFDGFPQEQPPTFEEMQEYWQQDANERHKAQQASRRRHSARRWKQRAVRMREAVRGALRFR